MPARISLVLLSGVTLAAAQAPVAGDAIQERLAAIAQATQVPALGAAFVTVDGLDRAWVTGVRAAGSEALVTGEDRWHLGSCTKAMTATLIALLVERGDLRWEQTLPELLPELRERLATGFAEVTLGDLLAHRAGVATMTAPDSVLRAAAALAQSVVEQRRFLAEALLTRTPASAPRAQFAYSNAGYVIAGHIAERTTGKAWEDLLRELLFAPLGMASAGFGPPGSAASLDQPRGHGRDGEAIPPGPEADNPPVLGPAGTVHASLADWAKFIQLHLRGARGEVKVGEITLPPAAFARLHAPWGDDDTSYAGGWGVARRDWAGGDHTVLTHSGSNTMWYCVCWLDRAGGRAMLAVTNTAAGKAAAACDQAVAMLLRQRGASK